MRYSPWVAGGGTTQLALLATMVVACSSGSSDDSSASPAEPRGTGGRDNAVAGAAGAGGSSSAAGGTTFEGIGNSGPDGDGGPCQSIFVPLPGSTRELLLVLDRSSSKDGSSDSWSAQVAAVRQLAATSTTLTRLGVVVFPSLNDSCHVDDYASPRVPLTPMSQLSATLDAELATVTLGMARRPTVAALAGALDYLRQASDPARETHLVLITGGPPNACEPQGNSDLAEAAADAWRSDHPIRTFILTTGAETGLGEVAAAGGSTEAITLDLTSESQLLAGLERVAGVPSCQFEDVDPPTDANHWGRWRSGLTLKSASRPYEPLAQRADRRDCAGGAGWYSASDNPARIYLCPASCEQLVNEADVTLAAHYECSFGAKP